MQTLFSSCNHLMVPVQRSWTSASCQLPIRNQNAMDVDTPTVELPTDEPHLNIHQVMTEHIKSKFNNLIYCK